MGLITDSNSKKGFGNGFISSSQRFTDTELQRSKYKPGPGQYNRNIISAPTKLEKTKSSCAFKGLPRGELFHTKKGPGPGTYDDKSDKITLFTAPTQECVFKSTVKKLNSIKV
jgi:hypothetical protein